MGSNLAWPASELVDLIKTIIRDEEGKKDRIDTATVLLRNGADDTYDICLDTEIDAQGGRSVARGVPNESKHVYAPGDHVYVMRVRGQVAQGFIIGSIGNMGASVNAKVQDLEEGLSRLSSDVAPAALLASPRLKAEAFRYKSDPSVSDANAVFGLRFSWSGGVLPCSPFYVYTDLTIAGDGTYSNGVITFNASVLKPTSDNAIRLSGASSVFSGSNVSKIPIVAARVVPEDPQHWFEIAFMNGGSPILYDAVTVNSDFVLGLAHGFVIMGSDYEFII